MSQENVEIVRRVFDGWIHGDFDAGADVWDPDIEFVMDASVGPSPSIARGVRAMGRAWRDYIDVFEHLQVGQVQRLIEVGDQVVVLNRLEGRGKFSGAHVTADRGAVFTFRDHRVVRLFLTTREEALEAVGLPE
jgi:ketosteroid isomerase-like protein